MNSVAPLGKHIEKILTNSDISPQHLRDVKCSINKVLCGMHHQLQD